MLTDVNNLLTPADMDVIRSNTATKIPTIYHAPTQEIAEAFSFFASELGIKWFGGDTLRKRVKYYNGMCYNVNEEAVTAHSDINFYKTDESYKHIPIYTLGES